MAFLPLENRQIVYVYRLDPLFKAVVCAISVEIFDPTYHVSVGAEVTAPVPSQCYAAVCVG